MINKKILIIILILFISIAFLLYMSQAGVERTPLVVFHAGSLSVPFTMLETLFEAEHPDVDVRLESAGSSTSIRKVTEQGRTADVVASSDYLLISKMMIPDYTDFYLLFTTNRLGLAYTDRSLYRDEITSDNWYDILLRPDVRFGFSNPNDDPCGYRSLMLVQLSAIYYDRPDLFGELIGNNSGYTMQESDGTYRILSPTDMSLNTSKILMRSSEVDLLAVLESGEIDYLFIYRSVAVQHESSGLSFLELPTQVNLGSFIFSETYCKVHLTQFADSCDESRMVNLTASPIIYAVTVPEDALHEEMAFEFLHLMLSPEGRQVFIETGHQSMNPALTNNMSSLPPMLHPFCSEV